MGRSRRVENEMKGPSGGIIVGFYLGQHCAFYLDIHCAHHKHLSVLSHRNHLFNHLQFPSLSIWAGWSWVEVGGGGLGGRGVGGRNARGA